MMDWADGITAAVGASWLSLLSWVGVREVKRLDGKADREELNRVLTLMEKRDSEYREDQKDARQGRRELHQKFDALGERLSETNIQLARLAGRLNGDGK